MLHGDLSNQSGYTIAFRCEDCLIKYKDNTFTDKVLNLIMGKTKRAEVDIEYARTMEYIYRHTEYTVDLIVEESSYTNELKKILEDLPYNRIVVITKETQIATRLLIGDITLYVDDNDYRRSLVNNSYAIPLKELSTYIKRRT